MGTYFGDSKNGTEDASVRFTGEGSEVMKVNDVTG